MFYLKKLFLLASIFSVKMIFCMENDLSNKISQKLSQISIKENSSIDSEWEKIETYDGIKKWHLKVFVFKTNCSKLCSDVNKINYGHIGVAKSFSVAAMSGCRFFFYVLRLDNDKLGFCCNDDDIKEWGLVVRSLTWDEAKKIKNLIDGGWSFSESYKKEDCYDAMCNLNKLLGSLKEKRKAVFELSPEVKWIFLGTKDPLSLFSRLPKDLLKLIIQFLIDIHIKEREEKPSVL